MRVTPNASRLVGVYAFKLHTMKTNIIGTGNSLRGYDFLKIEGHKIGLNYAYRYTDTNLNACFDDPKKLFPDNPPMETLKVYGGKWTNEGSDINMEVGKVANLNFSVFFAINVAMQIGFDEIHIYGCDNYYETYLHFYDDSPIPEEHKALYSRNFARIDRFFEYIKPTIERYGVKLYFYNSRIEHYNNLNL